MPRTEIEILNRVREIFEMQNWPILSGATAEQRERYDKFCQIALRIDKDTLPIFFALSEHFQKIDISMYPFFYSKIAEFMNIDELLKDYECSFAIPLVPTGKKGNLGSAVTATHLFATHVLQPAAGKIGLNAHVLDSKTSLVRYPSRGKSLIFVVDDFVGTGETARYMIDELESEILDTDTVIFGTIYSMCEGLSYIEDRGYKIYSAIIANRAVTSSGIFDESIVKSVLDKIFDVERQLKIGHEYYYGFRRSESLVSLVRTPDNTFPLYWAIHRSNGETWPAPFPRY